MRIVIDCDPGGGIAGANIDDVLALAYAARYHEVAAVWTVAGNVTSAEGWRCATETCSLLRLDVPVRRGADNPRVRPTSPGAAAAAPPPASAEVLAGDLAGADALICLGPLTNVARLMESHPAALEGLAVWAMAGSWDRPDTNARLDPAALARVLYLDSLTLVPITLTRHIAFPLTTWRRRAASPLAPWVDAWLEHPHCRRPPGALWIHDVVTAAGPEPGLVHTRQARLGLDRDGRLRPGPHAVTVATGASLAITRRLTAALADHNRDTNEARSRPRPLNGHSVNVKEGAL